MRSKALLLAFGLVLLAACTGQSEPVVRHRAASTSSTAPATTTTQAASGCPVPPRVKPDPEISRKNIDPIRTPVLILVGTADSLLPVTTMLHDALAAAGKSVRMEVYEHGYHDFCLGPQGHKRPESCRAEDKREHQCPRPQSESRACCRRGGACAVHR